MMRSTLAAGIVAVLVSGLTPGTSSAQQRAAVIDDIDRFALLQLDRVQPKSIRENRTYCGLIGFDREGVLSAVPARPGGQDSCEPSAPPAGFDVLASFRTLGAFGGKTGGELPGVALLQADFARSIDSYVSSPGGRVWLGIAAEELAYQLCGRGCVPSDKAAKSCKGFVPKIEYTILQLKQAEAKASGPC